MTYIELRYRYRYMHIYKVLHIYYEVLTQTGTSNMTLTLTRSHQHVSDAAQWTLQTFNLKHLSYIVIYIWKNGVPIYLLRELLTVSRRAPRRSPKVISTTVASGSESWSIITIGVGTVSATPWFPSCSPHKRVKRKCWWQAYISTLQAYSLAKDWFCQIPQKQLLLVGWLLLLKMIIWENGTYN